MTQPHTPESTDLVSALLRVLVGGDVRIGLRDLEGLVSAHHPDTWCIELNPEASEAQLRRALVETLSVIAESLEPPRPELRVLQGGRS